MVNEASSEKQIPFKEIDFYVFFHNESLLEPLKPTNEDAFNYINLNEVPLTESFLVEGL